jgi:hypothetical protein
MTLNPKYQSNTNSAEIQVSLQPAYHKIISLSMMKRQALKVEMMRRQQNPPQELLIVENSSLEYQQTGT